MPAKKPKGWVREPVRHGLAAKGIKTAKGLSDSKPLGHPPHLSLVVSKKLNKAVGRLRDARDESNKRWGIYRKARGKSKKITLEKGWAAHAELDKARKGLHRILVAIDADAGLPKPYRIVDKLGKVDIPGIQRLYRYPNRLGASVIMTELSYGGDAALYELVPIKWHDDKDQFSIMTGSKTYGISPNLGWLDPGDVKKELTRIQKMSKRLADPTASDLFDGGHGR